MSRIITNRQHTIVTNKTTTTKRYSRCCTFCLLYWFEYELRGKKKNKIYLSKQLTKREEKERQANHFVFFSSFIHLEPLYIFHHEYYYCVLHGPNDCSKQNQVTQLVDSWTFEHIWSEQLFTTHFVSLFRFRLFCTIEQF